MASTDNHYLHHNADVVHPHPSVIAGRYGRVFSSGAGHQSVAAGVLSAQQKIDFPVHLFANVGDDSEDPETLAYAREVLAPFLADNGIEYHELQRPGPTLLELALDPGGKRVHIPVRGSETGKPFGRQCTDKFKVQVVNNWIKAHGATADTPTAVGIGISVDEIQRATGRHGVQYRRVEYPLLTLGLRRSDCTAIIRAAGLPEPPPSSCYFCPFHRPSTWAEMRRDRPDLFAKAAGVEERINEIRLSHGQEPVFLTRFGVPLKLAISEAQPDLFDDQGGFESCDEGVCFV